MLKTINKNKEILIINAEKHINHKLSLSEDIVDLSEPCFLPAWHRCFELPSIDTLQKVIDLLVEQGHTKTTISKCLGIRYKNANQTLLRWLDPANDQAINKSNWILLCSLAGLVLPTMSPNEAEMELYEMKFEIDGVSIRTNEDLEELEQNIRSAGCFAKVEFSRGVVFVLIKRKSICKNEAVQSAIKDLETVEFLEVIRQVN